jgi:hypothetical protein
MPRGWGVGRVVEVQGNSFAELDKVVEGWLLVKHDGMRFGWGKEQGC